MVGGLLEEGRRVEQQPNFIARQPFEVEQVAVLPAGRNAVGLEWRWSHGGMGCLVAVYGSLWSAGRRAECSSLDHFLPFRAGRGGARVSPLRLVLPREDEKNYPPARSTPCPRGLRQMLLQDQVCWVGCRQRREIA